MVALLLYVKVIKEINIESSTTPTLIWTGVTTFGTTTRFNVFSQVEVLAEVM